MGGPENCAVSDAMWRTRGLCVERDPDLLFVVGAAQREAAKLCRGCPVKRLCLAEALDQDIEYGVWGGLTERQRRAMTRSAPPGTDWVALLA